MIIEFEIRMVKRKSLNYLTWNVPFIYLVIELRMGSNFTHAARSRRTFNKIALTCIPAAGCRNMTSIQLYALACHRSDQVQHDIGVALSQDPVLTKSSLVNRRREMVIIDL
uniref:Uncharacterized protein n=1 Tax=Romanomermis culicivorax TaxID=13658 RepID=A0A915IEW5_ROMCU